MYIRSVVLENVKSFSGRHTFNLKSGVNYFVGDNNSGKSTILEALLFLFGGPSKGAPDEFYCSYVDEATRVEVDIAGDLEALVEKDKFKIFKDYIFEHEGEKILRLERSSKERVVMQKNKEKRLDVKSVCFWNPELGQFENITGIDARVKALFEFETVWADANPGDYIDFSSNKTLGRLLDSSFKRFMETDPWRELVRAHENAFLDESNGSFSSEAANLAAEMKELIDQQYGEANYRFDFGLPDASIFMKQGNLHVDDGAGETPISGKGTGMQRAVALGLIQLYARKIKTLSDEFETPLILMLDEPETWLHPSAQLKLGEAIGKIGERDQVFVVTHSPYLIRKFDSNSHLLTVLSGKGDEREIDPSTNFGLFGLGEPTWGEINYRAFQVCSNEFHNELYGRIQKYLDARKGEGKSASEKEVDEYLSNEKCLLTKKVWKRSTGRAFDVTLPVYIRNSIHHPENTENVPFTMEELQESTDNLVTIVEEINSLESQG